MIVLPLERIRIASEVPETKPRISSPWSVEPSEPGSSTRPSPLIPVPFTSTPFAPWVVPSIET